MYYAHSTGDVSRSDWHLLKEHLEATAALASQFGEASRIGRAAALAGLLHDLGKYSRQFQARLDGDEPRVDHSTAGAAVAMKLATGNDKAAAELIAYAIAGHHAGLPDRHGESFSTLTERLNGFSEESLSPDWANEIAPDASGLVPDFVRSWHDRDRRPFYLAFLGRMLFSCLVDADFKDTEAFFGRIEGRNVDRAWPALQHLLPRLRKSFDAHMAGFSNRQTPVNELRGEILDHVRSCASQAAGFFTLSVPTGGGKTLASLGFALDHASIHGHRRIIYAIPFTTIIDQTAAIFKDVLGEDSVLEHHSAIEEDHSGRRAREGKDKLKLAMEDWAAPVIVTTNVQLFESLFAARPSACRKLHNVARSIVILDEAQTLPRNLLIPAVTALRALAQDYGCTIVLCTATQPALDERNFSKGHKLGLPLAGRELAPEPGRLAQRLSRVRLRRAGPMNDDLLVEALASEPQALVIVNTRKHALALYRAAEAAGLDGVVHLTTRQYAAHRRGILKSVRDRLGRGQTCRLIATSLVEAGVDLDFPRVWRAESGLDQIAQAAGRCNREGSRPIESSVVTIFSAPDHPPPHEIKALSSDMQRVIDKHTDWLSPAAIDDFFGEVYWRYGEDRLDQKRILKSFRFGNGGTDFAYRTVAQEFRMIESGMLPVIVPRDPKARDAVNRLDIEAVPSGVIARQLQPFLVQVPPMARDRLLACGQVKFTAPQLRGDQFATLQYDRLYADDVGLLWDDPAFLAADDAII